MGLARGWPPGANVAWTNAAGSIRASRALDPASDWDRTAAAFVATGREALTDGAEVLILGCSGMTGLQERVAAELGVPIVDGVAAAVALCESLVALGLTTSKVGTFASPTATKPRPGWPITKEERNHD